MAKTKVSKAEKDQKTLAQKHRHQRTIAGKRAEKAEAALVAANEAVAKATEIAVQARQAVVDADALVAADVAAAAAAQQEPPVS